MTIVAVVAMLMPVWAETPSFHMELNSPVKTLRIGQSARLNLNISGRGVYEITSATEGINTNSATQSSFTHNFSFKPQTTGNHTLGPYTVSLNGQKLTSNQIEIYVLPEYNGDNGTFFRVDRNSITLGEPVELVMETWANERTPFKHIFIKQSQSFSSQSGGTLSTIKSSSNKITSHYWKISWLIYPTESGDFQITKDLFQELPEDIEAPNFTIKVEEKK